jgi:hypothetical protein
VGRWRWGHCGWRVCAEGGVVGVGLMRAWTGA